MSLPRRKEELVCDDGDNMSLGDYNLQATCSNLSQVKKKSPEGLIIKIMIAEI